MPAKKRKKRQPHIELPGGCHMTQPNVYPSNWKTVAASCSIDWYITYRFFDPVHRPKGLVKMVKGMNDQDTAAARREATERAIADELLLLRQGFNPVTQKITPPEILGEMDETTPLPRALEMAFATCTVADFTKADIRSMMNWVPLAIIKLKWHMLPVSQVRPKHIRRILDACSTITSRRDEPSGKTIQAGWSNHKFNQYRSNLMILFSEIIELGGIDMNPCREVRKKKETKKRRATLTKEERRKVDLHLRKENYAFWRFTHIFFHSGAREIEIDNVKGKDVNLSTGFFDRLVKKRGTYEVIRTPIKDIARPLWEEVMAGCGKEDYVFGKSFVPASTRMTYRTISNTWKILVKDGLGIDVDFYALKHLNSEETAILAGDDVAAAQNAHTSTAMVVNIYDTGRKDRMDERMKKVNNPFV